MATEKTINTLTGWLTLRVSDESPWKEEVLDALCEEALRQVLVKLRLHPPGIPEPFEGERQALAVQEAMQAGMEGADGVRDSIGTKTGATHGKKNASSRTSVAAMPDAS